MLCAATLVVVNHRPVVVQYWTTALAPRLEFLEHLKAAIELRIVELLVRLAQQAVVLVLAGLRFCGRIE